VNFLLAEHREHIVPEQQRARTIAARLRNLGAPEHCWVFGDQIDGHQMKLDGALDALVGTRSGTIISCVAGKLAFLESEEERVILHKI